MCNKYAYNIQTLCQELHLYAFICQLYIEICLPYVLIYKVYADICRQKCACCMQKYVYVHVLYAEYASYRICIKYVVYMHHICTNMHTNRSEQ